jgi:hypothetical protein
MHHPAAIFLTQQCLSGTKASVCFTFRKSAIAFDMRYTLPTCFVPQSGQTPTLLGKIFIGMSSTFFTSSVMSRVGDAQTGHPPLSCWYSRPHFGQFMIAPRIGWQEMLRRVRKQGQQDPPALDCRDRFLPQLATSALGAATIPNFVTTMDRP